jgi:hypothetical protein
MRYSTLQWPLLTTASVAALVVVASLFTDPAYGNSGRCCNGTDNTSCSGCQRFYDGTSDVYVSVGTNPINFCNYYANPLTCTMNVGLCWTNTPPTALFSAGCYTSIGFSNEVFQIQVSQCSPYDEGCD